MRGIEYIVLHCTATPAETSVEDIKNYWKNTLGWKRSGYHYLISKDGYIHVLAPEEHVTNGVSGYNKNSIHVSYIGGIDQQGRHKDTRTEAQRQAMKVLINKLHLKYPQSWILGHRDFPNVKKECPCFDVKSWLKELKIES